MALIRYGTGQLPESGVWQSGYVSAPGAGEEKQSGQGMFRLSDICFIRYLFTRYLLSVISYFIYDQF